MKIRNHRLCEEDGTSCSFVRSPNQGGSIEAEYLVMHYTAGRSAGSSVNWLVNPDAQASAHIVIDADGSIIQLVPFNRKAWHAGASRWAGRTGLNGFSIGIELDKPGILTRFDKLPVSPLPTGTRLDIVSSHGSWRLVDVLGEVSGETDVQGWVHGRYIRRTA